MSNKGLAFIIFVLILLCIISFGLFYLKINPNMPLSQKIFGVPMANNDSNALSTNKSAPFTDNSLNENIVDTSIVDTPNPNAVTENGVTIVPQGGESDTVVPNSNEVVNTDTSNKDVTPVPPVVSVPDPITQVLKKGSKGSQVKIVQQFLIDNKYLKGKADGVFGSMTESAVKSFQSEYKINVDGVVDGQTRDTLNELLTQ